MAQLNQRPDRGWRSVRVQAAALVLAVAGMLGIGIVTARQVSASIDQLILDTARARLLSGAAQAVLSDLQDAETGQRGYLLTQRAVYLEPYLLATSRMEGALARLDGLAATVPSSQADVAALTQAARQKMAELAETIRLSEARQSQAALALVQTDQGRAEMNTAREAAGRIATRAENERNLRSQELQRRQTRVSDIMLVALGAGLVLLGVTALTLMWNRARLLRAQQRERELAARVEAAVEHVRDGVAVFDADGQMTLHNSRFASTLGLEDAGMPGKTLAALAESVLLDPPVLASAGPQPGPDTGPVVAEAKQGSRTLELWRSAMPDGGQMLAVADITRRVEAEAIARQAQKMEVLGQMTGGIAHDFNNLLQVVSANLELAASQAAEPEALKERLASAGAGVARGARLTRHLLAFARRQPLAPEALEPSRLLAGMEDMLRRTLGETVVLELVVGGGLWTMRADPVQMESAILNLALNGRDAMPLVEGLPSGRLTIEVANALLDAAYAESRVEVVPGQYLMFAVTDNGAGMAPEQLARATEPFYTTKPDGKGTGLGLPMVYGFAKQSGGHFQLYSEPGRGTTARLYIPRTNEASVQHPSVAERSMQGGGALVLLVEDDVAVRSAAVKTVQSLGYAVQEAANADAAMALLQAGCRPALLFTDVVMPGRLTSRELAEQARSMLPGLAVLFTSGYTQNAIVHNGQLDPGVNLISKPWRAEALAIAMRAALEAAQAQAPAVSARQRVLLVEDEALIRMTTADALVNLGFDVVEAGTARMALRRMQPPPDLLIVDLGLPDMDGRQLVQEIRAVLPKLPVVVASGSSDRGGDDFVWLAKPYDAQKLKTALETALGANAS